MNPNNTTPHFRRIREFHKKMGHVCPVSPEIPSEQVRVLGAKMIMEEALETIDALGVDVDNDGYECMMGSLSFRAQGKPDLVQIADGCADLSVVAMGALVVCGIPDKALLEEVDQNNLDKFGPGYTFREDGKLIKSPTHMAPDIRGVLREAGWIEEPTNGEV